MMVAPFNNVADTTLVPQQRTVNSGCETAQPPKRQMQGHE